MKNSVTGTRSVSIGGPVWGGTTIHAVPCVLGSVSGEACGLSGRRGNQGPVTILRDGLLPPARQPPFSRMVWMFAD